MGIEENAIAEGGEFSLKVEAKDARGEGIGKIGNFVVFLNNAKTRIGNVYQVKITKVHRTFAYAELKEHKHQFIGSGSIVDFS